MLERGLSGDTAVTGYIEAGGYKSKGLVRAVLERELSGDTAAGGYRSSKL